MIRNENTQEIYKTLSEASKAIGVKTIVLHRYFNGDIRFLKNGVRLTMIKPRKKRQVRKDLQVAIICNQTGKRYGSLKAAAKWYRSTQSAFSKHLKGEKPHEIRGHTFRREQPPKSPPPYRNDLFS